MPAVAFCGLGQMGAPMAARLAEASDVDLVVWNRSPQRAAPLVQQGARQAETPRDAAAGADVVFTMLSTREAVEEVLFGANGVVPGLAAGGGGGGGGGGPAPVTLVEMSTIGPLAVAGLRKRLPDHVDLLDAPVLGSVSQANDGKLKVFVGGEAEVLERCRPLLERLGTIRHLGPQGSGAAMKLVANLCLGVLMTGLGEALALAQSMDLDRGDVLDVLAESAIGVTVKSKRANIESGQWPPNFKLALAAKDMRLVAEQAEKAGVDLAVAGAAQRWIEAAEEAGLGDCDYSAVIERILVSSED